MLTIVIVFITVNINISTIVVAILSLLLSPSGYAKNIYNPLKKYRLQVILNSNALVLLLYKRSTLLFLLIDACYK